MVNTRQLLTRATPLGQLQVADARRGSAPAGVRPACLSPAGSGGRLGWSIRLEHGHGAVHAPRMHTSAEQAGSTTASGRTSARAAGAPAPTAAAAHTAPAPGRRPSRWSRARLIAPSGAGYVHVGASSGPWRLPPALPRARRRALLSLMHDAAQGLRQDPGVQCADVFRGVLRPPGTRSLSGQQPPLPAFDAVLLVQTEDPAGAAALARVGVLTDLVGELEAAGAVTLAFAASNARRIGDVDHDRPGVFLFNYFTADEVEANLHARQFTAGWFQDQTGLDNSTVLRPLDPSACTLVNHCRWDRLRDVLPALVLRPSFRTFVLRTFAEHRTAPRPVLYRLAR